jgi:hypothetical protein
MVRDNDFPERAKLIQLNADLGAKLEDVGKQVNELIHSHTMMMILDSIKSPEGNDVLVDGC